MEWLGPGLAVLIVLGVLAWTATRVGIWNTIGAVLACVAIASLAVVISLGVQQL